MYSDVHHRLPARLKCWVSLAFDSFFFLFESDENLLFVIVLTWNSVALMITDQVLFWIPKNTFIVLWFAWETRAKYSQIIIDFVLEFIGDILYSFFSSFERKMAESFPFQQYTTSLVVASTVHHYIYRVLCT